MPLDPESGQAETNVQSEVRNRGGDAGDGAGLAFIATHRGIRPVAWLCDVPGVSRSGVHARLSRPLGEREIQDAKPVAAIGRSFQARDRSYDARRVRRDVLDEGLSCGLHRIERHMRQCAMRARPKRRGRPGDVGARSAIADRILARDFDAPEPNRKLLADFIFIRTAEGWLHVADGWSMKAERRATLVMDALMMTARRRRRSKPGYLSPMAFGEPATQA